MSLLIASIYHVGQQKISNFLYSPLFLSLTWCSLTIAFLRTLRNISTLTLSDIEQVTYGGFTFQCCIPSEKPAILQEKVRFTSINQHFLIIKEILLEKLIVFFIVCFQIFCSSIASLTLCLTFLFMHSNTNFSS